MDGAARVLIIGDDPLARSGLSAMLAGQAGLVVVGQTTPDDLPDFLRLHDPGVALWDLGLEPRAALGRMRALPLESLPVLALVPDDRLAAEVLGSGVRGLLMRDADAARLASAAIAAWRGNLVIDEVLAAAVLPGRPAPADSPAEPLTARELEVLQLLAQGMANKAIAARLGISDHTAKFHVNAILGKLGAASRTEAVVVAVRHGLVAL
jgi:two-component system nitrate/nitrite response regulator NarL